MGFEFSPLAAESAGTSPIEVTGIVAAVIGGLKALELVLPPLLRKANLQIGPEAATARLVEELSGIGHRMGELHEKIAESMAGQHAKLDEVVSATREWRATGARRGDDGRR